MNKKLLFELGLIFLVAIILRFLYFPGNVYFGFDQARDAFASLEIFSGNLRLVGPPTSGNLFHHGVLYYYLFGPLYAIFGGNPEAISAFLRIFNSLGIFIVFAIGVILFNPRVGIISALLFAFSYEQTQFSLFLNHPSLAVISVLIFYLGVALWIFKKKNSGFLIALFGLGLSIQFEFVELQLILIFLLFILFFRKKIVLKFSLRNLILWVTAFFIPISTYLAAELKNNFYTLRNLNQFFTDSLPNTSKLSAFDLQLSTISRFITDNILFLRLPAILIGLILLVFLINYFLKKDYQEKILFLLIWFFGGLLIYFVTRDGAYFYNTATSVSLIIFISFLLGQILKKNIFIAMILISFILISNLFLIIKNNPSGPNPAINPQKGLLLTDEKKVIDLIYQEANGKNFAVNALTMPLNVNTTWSYLFEWYGLKRYGYLPIWGGDAAEGYYGNLKVEKARSRLPEIRFLIIEPKDGIHQYLIDQFLATEDIFTTVNKKIKIGTMEIWVQKAKNNINYIK